eukprot:scaffold461_cov321-Pavlova_lutheri.AAC.51
MRRWRRVLDAVLATLLPVRHPPVHGWGTDTPPPLQTHPPPFEGGKGKGGDPKGCCHTPPHPTTRPRVGPSPPSGQTEARRGIQTDFLPRSSADRGPWDPLPIPPPRSHVRVDPAPSPSSPRSPSMGPSQTGREGEGLRD